MRAVTINCEFSLPRLSYIPRSWIRGYNIFKPDQITHIHNGYTMHNDKVWVPIACIMIFPYVLCDFSPIIIGEYIRPLSTRPGLMQHICHPLSCLQQAWADLTTLAFTSVILEPAVCIIASQWWCDAYTGRYRCCISFG